MTVDDTRVSSSQASLSNILLFTALNADLTGLPEQMEREERFVREECNGYKQCFTQGRRKHSSKTFVFLVILS